MATVNISLPGPMKEFVEAEVTQGGYMTPIDGGNTGYSYAACDAAHQPAFSAARMFLDLSWRHQQEKAAWCAGPPSDARINVAYADGHVRAATIAQLSDYRQWSILQGAGDVGCHVNKDGDGSEGCWYP